MVRYAEWREAIDPERPLERFDPLVQFAWASLAAVVGMMCCGCVSVPAFWFTYRSFGKHQFFRRVRRLRDDPPRCDQAACRLILEQGSVEFGRDEGLASLIDGAILFEGRRTSFSIPNDLGTLEHLSRSGFSFRFPTPAGDCRAIVRVFEEEAMASMRHRPLGNDAPPTVVVVYPPFRPEDRAWFRVGDLERLCWAVGVLGIVFGLAWASVVEPDPGLVAAGAAMCATFSGLRIAWRRRRILAHLLKVPLPSPDG